MLSHLDKRVAAYGKEYYAVHDHNFVDFLIASSSHRDITFKQ
jgi:hypothetical protein